MLKEILVRIGKKAVLWGLHKLYNYVDKDDDYKISWYEIKTFIDESRELLTKIKRKL